MGIYREAKAQVLRTAVRGLRPVTQTPLNADRQPANGEQLRDGKVDWHRPFLAVPVIDGFGLQREGPGVVVGE